MRKSFVRIGALLILTFLGVLLWQGSHQQVAASVNSPAKTSDSVINEPIQPIPLTTGLDQRRVVLGKRLFQEPQFSHDNTIACSSCHNLSSGGVDHSQHAVGINGTVGNINTPTIYNSGFNFRQFWNGRAATLEEQASGPIHNPIEMGSNWAEVITKLNASTDYVTAFVAIYPDGITSTNIADSIAIFERSLSTPNSRFDQFLRGNKNAITAEEQQGYELFKSYGCVSCHQGVNVGGNMYQRMGIVSNYFTDRGGAITNADLGRFDLTGNEQDRYVFKVPSLRLVALTAPYLHDGSVPTLKGAVEVMAYYQLGRPISADDVNLITQFLKSLAGENAELDNKGGTS